MKKIIFSFGLVGALLFACAPMGAMEEESEEKVEFGDLLKSVREGYEQNALRSIEHQLGTIIGFDGKIKSDIGLLGALESLKKRKKQLDEFLFFKEEAKNLSGRVDKVIKLVEEKISGTEGFPEIEEKKFPVPFPGFPGL